MGKNGKGGDPKKQADFNKQLDATKAGVNALNQSFFESNKAVFETKIDNLIGSPRIEYHCKKCGGHHGHIFDDGPEPTKKRYCNNGVCLVFKPKV